MELPDHFIQRMEETFPQEAEGYFASFKAPRHYGLRTNTLKISPEGLKNLLDFPVEPVNWCDTGFYYDGTQARPARSPFYHGGLFYIQEPSAMAPASVFPVVPGDLVLDLCAAPGGKTTHLAAKLKGGGLIVANDISNTRCRGLVKNMEAAGITNGVVLNETPERLSQRLPGFFDKILIDAPCSGEGMFRKDADAIKNYSRYKSEQCTQIQRSILHYADQMLKPGGMLLYSTCTFSPAENEEMVVAFCEKKGYTLLPVPCASYGFSPGLAPGTARLWPHKQKGEGHFLALLQKGAATRQKESAALSPAAAVKPPPLFLAFAEQNLCKNFEANTFALHGASLYSIPKELPCLKGLRIIRTGFYLGDLKKERFEPSQALAMGLKAEEAKRIISYNREEENLFRYLRGESFPVDCDDGYALVCVENFPLGFGKVQKGRLKNKYLKSWIMN